MHELTILPWVKSCRVPFATQRATSVIKKVRSPCMALLPQLRALLRAEAEHIKGCQAREPLGLQQQAGSSDGRW